MSQIPVIYKAELKISAILSHFIQLMEKIYYFIGNSTYI